MCFSKFLIYYSIGCFSSLSDLILWSSTNLKFSKCVFIFLKSLIFFSFYLITSSLSPNYSCIFTNLVLESSIFLWNYSYSYPNLNCISSQSVNFFPTVSLSLYNFSCDSLKSSYVFVNFVIYVEKSSLLFNNSFSYSYSHYSNATSNFSPSLFMSLINLIWFF
jgi:hypothetical protein